MALWITAVSLSLSLAVFVDRAPGDAVQRERVPVARRPRPPQRGARARPAAAGALSRPWRRRLPRAPVGDAPRPPDMEGPGVAGRALDRRARVRLRGALADRPARRAGDAAAVVLGAARRRRLVGRLRSVGDRHALGGADRHAARDPAGRDHRRAPARDGARRGRPRVSAAGRARRAGAGGREPRARRAGARPGPRAAAARRAGGARRVRVHAHLGPDRARLLLARLGVAGPGEQRRVPRGGRQRAARGR